MAESTSQQLLINRSDFVQCAALVEARFQDPIQEASRVEITRRYLALAFSVERALRAQSRCALVNHCGTHGTSNLAEATETLFECLYNYAALTREIAGRSRNGTPGSRVRNDGRVALEVA